MSQRIVVSAFVFVIALGGCGDPEGLDELPGIGGGGSPASTGGVEGPGGSIGSGGTAGGGTGGSGGSVQPEPGDLRSGSIAILDLEVTNPPVSGRSGAEVSVIFRDAQSIPDSRAVQ